MKLVLLTICCVLAILKQNAEGAAEHKKKIISTDDTEVEENDNRSFTLMDLLEKAGDSKEDYNVSFMKKRHVPKNVTTSSNKNKPTSTKKLEKRKKGNRRSGIRSRKNYLLKSYPTHLENDIQERLAREANNAKQSIEQSEDVANNRIGEIREDNFLNSAESNSLEETLDNGLIRRSLGGSVEDETIEDDGKLGGRRTSDVTRKFEDVYRYENEPLKQMLTWLVMNAVNPSIKNAVKASKTAVDRYVKHTVDKAGSQAALRYTDYTSLRFDKDRIIMYCGGQMYVYNTLKDSKICFNGQDNILGCILYASDRDRIQRVQNSCLRYIFGIRKYDRISHELNEIAWLNMKNRHIQQSATSVFIS